MAMKTNDGEYSLKLTGSGISIDKTVSEQIALQVLRLAMGDTSGSESGSGGGAGSIGWRLSSCAIYHGVAADEAQSIIETLVTRQVPAVQDFDGFLKVLNTSLKVSEYVLLILYERGTAGATYDEIESWVHPSMRANLQRTPRRLTDDQAYIHSAKGKCLLTKSGAAEVERKKLHATNN